MLSENDPWPRYRATAERGHVEPDALLMGARDDHLTSEEIVKLATIYVGWKPKVHERSFLAAHAILAGWKAQHIVETFGVSTKTVAEIRKRLAPTLHGPLNGAIPEHQDLIAELLRARGVAATPKTAPGKPLEQAK